jgi:hypothetical protein
MNYMFRILVLTVIFALAACNTTKAVKPTMPEAAAESVPVIPDVEMGKKIGARAVLRWKNIVGGKFAEAYEMLSPGYRQTHDRKEYVEVISNRPVHWTNATFVGTDCASPDLCTVRVNISFEVMMPSVGTVPSENILEEKWIRAGNEWFFFPASAGK